MEPTLQGFLEFHGETLQTQYEMYMESLKPQTPRDKPPFWKGEDPRKDDINTITNSMEKVKIDEKLRKDDIDTITDSMEKVKIEEKPKKKGRKCSLCKEYGHNKRTCPTIKNDKPEKKVKKKKSEKKIIKKVEFNYDNFIKEKYDLKYGECICDLCHTDFTNNMLTNHNDKN